jgi:hypothetical protein
METSENSELTVTTESLAPILKLDKLQVKSALRQHGFGDQVPLPRYMILRLLLADLLERLAFLKASQRSALLDEYDFATNTNGKQWETLAFADGNWCTWSGHTGWLDLTTGDTVNALPAAPVETIGYNLVTLYTRAMAKLRKRNTDGKEHPAGSVDEP